MRALGCLAPGRRFPISPCAPLAQRISASYHLGPLSRVDSIAYIRHRLTFAGATTPIFTDGACAAVYEGSHGVPRLINILCDTAMVYGYAEGAAEVGESIIADVVRDFSNGIQRGGGFAVQGPGVTPAPKPRASPQKHGAAFDREMAKELFASLRGK